MSLQPACRAASGLRLLASVALVLALGPARVMAQAPNVEPAVKATYLYKFAPFVEWPANAFGVPADSLVICVVGTDAVANLVDEAVKGQTVRGRVVTVLHVTAPARDSRCQILYVASRGESALATLNSVRGRPVLTVTDSMREARAQGIINFVVQDNRVRFEIDLNAASENHLVISSKLLSLAAGVRQ